MEQDSGRTVRFHTDRIRRLLVVHRRHIYFLYNAIADIHQENGMVDIITTGRFYYDPESGNHDALIAVVTVVIRGTEGGCISISNFDYHIPAANEGCVRRNHCFITVADCVYPLLYNDRAAIVPEDCQPSLDCMRLSSGAWVNNYSLGKITHYASFA